MARRFFALLSTTIVTIAALGPQALNADPFPPDWSNGAGAAIHYAPVAWPSEPASAVDCGSSCGDWKPYTRFQNDLQDARTKDTSNGGTSPQSYVNVASSCIDQTEPSIYYYLHQGASEAEDVLMFRWRVESAAHNYATGPNAGSYSSGNPWSSALWTVFFDIEGSGYRRLAAHLDGSSGNPSEAVDILAGVWGNSSNQSLDYVNDANIHLIGHNPTAFSGATGKVLNFQDSLTPVETWSNGSAETSWDYGTSRAKLISKNSCTEYFVDYQIPIALLDATGLGGPSITRNTPISMMFCTANSLNNPLQKDCAVAKEWLAGTGVAAPFGDYLSFNQTTPYSQPIVAEITATAPASCPGSYDLSARVQDTLALNNGVVVSSIQSVDFYYWFDANGDGDATSADVGSTWVEISNSATLDSGTLSQWSASWDSTGLAKGKYLIAAQALDDNTKVDDGMVASGVDNRTFSYLPGDSVNEIYINSAWKTGEEVIFPLHSPALTPSADEDWYGNPDVTGSQIAVVGTAINVCGIAPTIAQTISESEVGAGDLVTFSVTVTNPADNSGAIELDSLSNTLPDGFSYVGASSAGTTTSDPVISSQLLTWTLGSSVSLAPGASSTLSFNSTATAISGTYNNTVNAGTSFGPLNADPLAIAVDAVRISMSVIPDTYSVAADGSDQITFTVNYANDSTISVNTASITTSIASDSTYVTCTGGASCSESGGTVTWTVGDIPAASSGNVSYTITVANTWPATSLSTTANLSATDPASNAIAANASASVAVTGVSVATPASFSLSKSASAIQIAPGGSVTYTLSYNNYGGTTASSVVLTDTLPSGMTYSSCSDSCSETSGVVTWNIGTVASAASGSVTVIAVADNPFTSINPSTNQASVDWSGGTTVSTTAGVGITGQACNDYYFSDTTGDVGFDGTDRLALLSPVPTSGDTGSSVSVTAPGKSGGLYIEGLRFYQDPATLSDVPFSGDITTNIYIDRSNGPALNLRTTVYDYNSTTGGITSLGQDITSFNGSSKGLLTVTVTAAGTLSRDHRLLWVFEAQSNHNSNTYDVQFQYGGTVTNAISGGTTAAISGASFCVTPPANLLVSTTSSVSDLEAASTESVVYTIDYANTGSVDTTNTSLVNTLPSGFTACEYSTDNTTWLTCSDTGTPLHTFSLGTVTGGASSTVYVRGNAPSGSSDGNTLTNTSAISSDQTSQISTTTDIAVTAVGAGGTAELAMTLYADTTNIVPGDLVTYTATVINIGSVSAANVAVTNTLPIADYYTYDSCTGGCANVSNTLTWTTGTLAAGASQSYNYSLLAGSTNLSAGVTSISDDVTASADGLSNATSNQVDISLSGNPALSLGSVAGPNSGLSPGDIISYTITISNTGSVSASDVQVYDPIPGDTQYVGNITVTIGSATFDAVNNRVIYSAGDIANGASATLTFDVSVSEKIPSGNTTITNTLSASAANALSTTDQVTATASASAVLSISQTQSGSSAYPTATLIADVSNNTKVSVDKPSHFSIGQSVLINGTLYTIIDISSTSITLDNVITASTGDIIIGSVNYSISYLHTGDADALNVVLTEDLPPGLNYYAASPSADTAPTVGVNGDLVWNIGTVETGKSGVFNVLVFPDGTTGALTTTATITASNATTDTASVITNIGGLSVNKSTSTPLLTAGDIASYTITLTNSLATDIVGVSVTDILPQGFNYRTGTATVGGASSEPTFDVSDTELVQPQWVGLTVSANSNLLIQFDVDINAGAGAGIYQNELAVTGPVGAGIQSFDPLVTNSDDVTLFSATEGVIAGYVFNRSSATGSVYVVGEDVALADVQIEIYQTGADCSDAYDPLCFISYTNNDGYFSKIVESGNWFVKVINNTGDLNDNSWVQLIGENDDELVVTAQTETTDHNGWGVLTGTSTVTNFNKTVAEDDILTFSTADFLAAFSDVNGGSDLERIRVDSLPSDGLLTLSGSNVTVNDEILFADIANLVYTPDADFNGADSFTWNATDGLAYDDTSATVNITVTPVADPSEVTLSNIAKTIDEDTSLTFALTDFTSAIVDSSGGNAINRIRIVSLPSNGLLTLSGGSVSINDEITAANIANLIYTPTADYNGSDTFIWNGHDGAVFAASTASVNITVTPVADPGEVTLSNIAKTIDEDTSLTFALTDFTSAIVDSSGGNTLNRIRIESLPSSGLLTLSGGSVSINDEIVAADIANLIYAPTADYNGSDAFTWNGNDGVAYSGSTASVNITVTPVADPGEVTLSNIAKTIDEDTSLTFALIDFTSAIVDSSGGNAINRIRIVSLPVSGLLTLSGGSVAINDEITAANIANLIYAPTAGYNGSDTFTWNANDGAVFSASAASVNITVTPVADLGEVTLSNIIKTVAEDTSLTFTLIDFTFAIVDSSGGNTINRIRIESLPSNGLITLSGESVVINDEIVAANIANLVYTPSMDFNGSDTFIWNANDGSIYSASSASVNISVTPNNDGPEVPDDEITVDPDQVVTVDVISTAQDPEDDPLTIISATSDFGTVDIVDNELVFTPEPQFSGVAEITYMISDGNGGFAEATVVINVEGDGSEPLLTVPADILLDANALYTKIELGVASSEDRFGNPLPVSLIDGITFFEPGVNRAFWESIDDDGNRRVEVQEVRVRPLVSISKDQKILEGESTSVGIYLNGLSPVYPLVVPYVVGGTASNLDHTLSDGQLTIESGTEGFISFRIENDDDIDGNETIEITLDSSLNRGNKYVHTLTIVEGNVAPTVTLSVIQDNESRLVVSREVGASTVVISAVIVDSNDQDTHSYVWQVERGTATDVDASDSSFTLDPSTLAAGLYVIEVTVTDDGNPALSDSAKVYIDIIDELVQLDFNTDSDLDLIPDAFEGYSDSDADGIPDYLDSRDECNVLPEQMSNLDAYQIEGDPGVCLRKGFYTVQGESGGAMITNGDIDELRNDIVEDTEATNVGGIFDYIGYGLPVLGQSYRIVLPQRLPIPESAVYRKFTGGIWGNFIETSRDQLASAPGELGFCPPPGGDIWQAGLNLGHWCVQLTITDGGPNDDDNLANGVIVDPGGVAVLLSTNTAPVVEASTVETNGESSTVIDPILNATDSDGDDLIILTADTNFGTVEITPNNTLNYIPPENYFGNSVITYTISDGNGGITVSTITVTVNAVESSAFEDVKFTTKGGGGSSSLLFVILLSLVSFFRKISCLESSKYDIKTLISIFVFISLIMFPAQYVFSGSESHPYNESTIDNETENVRIEDGAKAFPWFVKARVGLSASLASKDDINRQFDAAGLDATATSFDSYDVGYSVSVGYQFDKHWSAEVGLLNLGDFAIDFEGNYTDEQAFYDAVEHIHPESAQGLFLAGAYRWLPTENLAVQGRAGIFSWKGDYNTRQRNSSAGRIGQNSQNSTDAFIGATASYILSKQWETEIGWERHRFDNHDVDFFNLGLFYRFGWNRTRPAVTVTPEPIPMPEPAANDKVCELFSGSLQGVNFETASANLTVQAKESLLAVIKTLQDFPTLQVEVRAHTDWVGSEQANQALSAERAKSVMDYFSDQGVDVSRLTSKGFGESTPIADNNTQEGRAENRRVELKPGESENNQEGFKCVSAHN